jgi:hypothetical protein
VVIKGNARGSPADLAKHLQRRDTNERVEILGLRGVAALDLAGALQEMDAFGAGLRTTRTLYHASINVPAHERLTPEQRAQAIDRLESALGLTGQPRAVVEHEKPNRAGEMRVHCHVVWSRTDLDHMRAIRCDHNFRTHELVARALEREFGHARVQGVHVERDGPNGERIERPARTPSHAEMQQAQRGGIDPHAMKAEITALWQATDSGKSFAAALEQHGYVLARGDRRDFVILDAAGEVHSLARRIEGVTAKDVRARMADIDAGTLPDIAQARAIQEARQVARAERAPEIPTPAAEVDRGASLPAPHPARIFDQENREGREAQPERASPARDAEVMHGPEIDAHAVDRAADKIAGVGVGLLGKALGAMAGLFEGLFATPKPPPSPDEQRRDAMAADEEERLRAFRQFAAERAQQSFTINDRITRDRQQHERAEQEQASRRAQDGPARYGPER